METKNKILEQTNEWKKMKKEREEKMEELKTKTKEAMEKLDSQLKTYGMWDHTWICEVAFYDDGDDTGYGDQKAFLYWDKEKGYEIKYFEAKHGGQWEPIENDFDMKVEQVNLENINSHHLMAIAEALPNRIRQLSELYMEEISNIETLIKNIE